MNARRDAPQPGLSVTAALQAGTPATPSFHAVELIGKPAACVSSPVILQGAHATVSGVLAALTNLSLSLVMCNGMDLLLAGHAEPTVGTLARVQLTQDRLNLPAYAVSHACAGSVASRNKFPFPPRPSTVLPPTDVVIRGLLLVVVIYYW